LKNWAVSDKRLAFCCRSVGEFSIKCPSVDFLFLQQNNRQSLNQKGNNSSVVISLSVLVPTGHRLVSGCDKWRSKFRNSFAATVELLRSRTALRLKHEHGCIMLLQSSLGGKVECVQLSISIWRSRR
jgi:hypothetical protein